MDRAGDLSDTERSETQCPCEELVCHVMGPILITLKNYNIAFNPYDSSEKLVPLAPLLISHSPIRPSDLDISQ